MVLLLRAHSCLPRLGCDPRACGTQPVLYFARQHASFAFELPPNPHLTREQHAAWKEQVEGLPQEKVDAAYEELYRETGLTKDEL